MIKDRIQQDLEHIYKEKPHRLDHVYGVRDTAMRLGNEYNCDIEKLELAALLHDLTKYLPHEEHIRLIRTYYSNADEILKEFNPNILHAFSAVVVAHEEYHITDHDILGAIEHHTIGKPAMTIYEKILFVSDYIEPNRTYESCIKVRKIAEESLDKAVFAAIDDSIRYYETHDGQIPQTAYAARDYYQAILEETT